MQSNTLVQPPVTESTVQDIKVSDSVKVVKIEDRRIIREDYSPWWGQEAPKKFTAFDRRQKDAFDTRGSGC